MTLTLPDMATPAQPPTDGLLSLLQYALVTGGVIALGMLLLALAAAAPLPNF